MKTSNDNLGLALSTISVADLAGVTGGYVPADPGGGSTSTSTTTTTNTNKGADPAYYCKDGLAQQVSVKDASLKFKTPAGFSLEGHVSGDVTICK